MQKKPLNKLPRCWDPALEEILSIPVPQAHTRPNVTWSDTTKSFFDESRTFFDVINVKRPAQAIDSVTGSTEIDPVKQRENKIRRMILQPLSPRKPIIIPCSESQVKQRDKQKLEKVMRARQAKSSLSEIIDVPIEYGYHQEAKRNSYRPLMVESTFKSAPVKKQPIFYWGT